MTYAPIVLFTYDRLDHTRRTIDALLENHSVQNHDLIIFSDAPSSPNRAQNVNDVRKYLLTISGFRSITIKNRLLNFGLAKSIIDGVSSALVEFDCVIVLEDDLVTSPYFLTFMNDSLQKYANDERVISIHGYVYPVKESLPEAFFLRGADCWGWATWRRGWNLFNIDGKSMLNELNALKLTSQFNFNNSYLYSKMLQAQIQKRNDSWAILWYASAFLADKLTLYPGISLVHNIGNDDSGTHCESTDSHDVILSKTPIDLSKVVVCESDMSRKAFENFFRKNKGGLVTRFKNFFRRKLVNLIKGYL
jgi:hypothetical protein